MTEFFYRDDRAERPWRLANVPLRVERPDDLPARVAELLAAGKAVGWFQGGSEFGPRALGQRSILADPRDPNMPAFLNERIKHRQWFRPYAPAVLLEHLPEWFELDAPSPHMLLVARVRPEKRAAVPAIVHVDGTARIQTVAPESGPFRRVIESFHAVTGVPLVLNTSFNDHGEPIVETPLDAYQCFAATDLAFLAIGPLLIAKDGSHG
jgi:carbamoyltransferase